MVVKKLIQTKGNIIGLKCREKKAGHYLYFLGHYWLHSPMGLGLPIICTTMKMFETIIMSCPTIISLTSLLLVPQQDQTPLPIYI